MATQSATISCRNATTASIGDTPPTGAAYDHIVLFDFISTGNTVWVSCEEMKNHFLLDPEPVELNAELIQAAFIGIISLWAIGVGAGLIIAMVRKLRA